jgi:hypothetical protein
MSDEPSPPDQASDDWINSGSQDGRLRIRQLAHDLRKLRPPGWSVTVRGNSEVVVRPQERGLGKFSITPGPESWDLAFFSRALNHWSFWISVRALPNAANTLLETMMSKTLREAADIQIRRNGIGMKLTHTDDQWHLSLDGLELLILYNCLHVAHDALDDGDFHAIVGGSKEEAQRTLTELRLLMDEAQFDV